MSLKARFARLARVIDERFGEEADTGPEPSPFTIARRVESIRCVLGALRHGPDPFPDLQGKDYLRAFWPWFLERGATWPEWARDTAFRFAYPRDALGYALPCPESRGEMPALAEFLAFTECEGCPATKENHERWRKWQARHQDTK